MTRAKIEKYLFEGASRGGFIVTEKIPSNLNPNIRKELYKAGCIKYLENINIILTNKKLHSTVDFMKIVDGTFFLKIGELKMLDYAAYLPLGESFLDFLAILHGDFARGIISNDYKFQELDPKGKYTYKEAAVYCRQSLSTINKAVAAGKLEIVLKQGKPEKGGENGKENLILGKSIIDFKK